MLIEMTEKLMHPINPDRGCDDAVKRKTGIKRHQSARALGDEMIIGALTARDHEYRGEYHHHIWISTTGKPRQSTP